MNTLPFSRVFPLCTPSIYSPSQRRTRGMEELVMLGAGCVPRSLVTGRLIMQHGQERRTGLGLKHKQTN